MDDNYYLYKINNNIECYENIYNNYINRDYENCCNHSHNVMQFYRLYDCYNLMLNYNNLELYDYIVRSRLDIIFDEDLNKYFTILDNDSNNQVQFYGFADFFGIGRVNVMEYYCNMIKNNYGTYKSYNGDDYIRWRYAPETQLSLCLHDYCNKNGLKYDYSIRNLDLRTNFYR